MPAPLHLLQPTLKKHKKIKPLLSTGMEAATNYKAQRSTLGTTFGTKKAVRNIRAHERNLMDAGSAALQSLQPFLKSELAESAINLPSDLETMQAVASAKPIPEPDLTATEASKVYLRAKVVPDDEFAAIPIHAFEKAADAQARIALLPFTGSVFINDRLNVLFALSDTDDANAPKRLSKRARERLALLVYLDFLVTSHFADRARHERDLSGRLGGHVPQVVVSGIWDRFTEVSRDGVTCVDDLFILCFFLH